MKTIKLSNGVEMPVLGFGCAFGNWTSREKFFGLSPDLAWQPITDALEANYRHFDTAYVYGTHGILNSILGLQYAKKKIVREDIFLTTKVYHPPMPLGLSRLKTIDINNTSDIKERVLYDFEHCLDELGHGYVDLLLMHWPGEAVDEATSRSKRRQCWEAFEEIYKSGMARAIGVSNFSTKQLDEMIAKTSIVPHVNQIELSPYITQEETQQYCQEKNIVLTAWSPFGSGTSGVLKDPIISAIAQSHTKNTGQVILRWLFQQNIVALPKSSNIARMKSNLEIFDFELSPREMASISKLNKNSSSIR